jgi:5-formyltetrahydrofolate cyclo-ligase
LKSALRRNALAKRDGLSERSAPAVLVLSGPGKFVSAYHAIGSELDPAPLTQALAAQGACLALPVLLDSKTMVFRLWDRSRPLVPVGFGTLGPDADQPEVLPDLILAPLVAFSATGQRIGYGKGHYDRALAAMHAKGHHPAYVGLAFDEQEVAIFGSDPHDIALDGVLTPSGLRVFAQGHAALAPFLR